MVAATRPPRHRGECPAAADGADGDHAGGGGRAATIFGACDIHSVRRVLTSPGATYGLFCNQKTTPNEPFRHCWLGLKFKMARRIQQLATLAQPLNWIRR